MLGELYNIDLGNNGTTFSSTTCVGKSGNGNAWFLTRSETSATNVPAGSKVYGRPSPDGTHLGKGANDQALAALVPQAAEKAKFAVYAGMI